jgi:hypothetical protein|tara:strand:- start:3036 stop:3221 length:186 start_codon:yes stop_codon:yes gene_type:complete|eukprot:SAG11_NODE_35714_length_265_cov_0.873494_1_plen_62_part_00
MCRERAKKIIKDLNITISNMKPIVPCWNMQNELFTPTRVSKEKLKKIKNRLIKKYNLLEDN